MNECPACGERFSGEWYEPVYHCLGRVPHAGFDVTCNLVRPYQCCCGGRFFTPAQLANHVMSRGGLWLHYYKSVLGIDDEPQD